MKTVETTGETVEEAVAKGLEELGAAPDDVMVEILEEPSRGLFGLGAKPARVRLVLMVDRTPPPPRPEPVPEREREPKKPAPRPTLVPAAPVVDEAELDEDARVARQIVMEIMEKMGIRAEVVVQRSETARDDDSSPWIINVTGRDVQNLIGRRGETLASLQYITRLIASRRLQRRADIVVDVAGYKSQRSDRLKQLAHRMADQAVEQGRIVILEPMPANERRIVHLALRGREDVVTKSEGDGSSRKVTIVPK